MGCHEVLLLGNIYFDSHLKELIIDTAYIICVWILVLICVIVVSKDCVPLYVIMDVKHN